MMTAIETGQPRLPLTCGDSDILPVPQPIPISPVNHGTAYKCPDLDLSLTLTPERPANPELSVLRGAHGRSMPLRQVRFNLSPSRARASSPHTAKAAEGPVVVSVIAEPANNQILSAKETQKSHKGREGQRTRKGKGRLSPNAGSVSTESTGSDGELTEGAELNTTLALKAELHDLDQAKFDSKKAVQEKLKTSKLTKDHISAKAAEGLNFPRSKHLYRSLVSVSLSHDQLISQALRDRPALAPPTRSHSDKSQPIPVEAPDLLAFYSPGELLRETPLLPGNQFPLPCPKPVPRPSYSTFDLYHLNRQWET